MLIGAVLELYRLFWIKKGAKCIENSCSLNGTTCFWVEELLRFFWKIVSSQYKFGTFLIENVAQWTVEGCILATFCWVLNMRWASKVTSTTLAENAKNITNILYWRLPHVSSSPSLLIDRVFLCIQTLLWFYCWNIKIWIYWTPLFFPFNSNFYFY